MVGKVLGGCLFESILTMWSSSLIGAVPNSHSIQSILFSIGLRTLNKFVA